MTEIRLRPRKISLIIFITNIRYSNYYLNVNLLVARHKSCSVEYFFPGPGQLASLKLYLEVCVFQFNVNFTKAPMKRYLPIIFVLLAFTSRSPHNWLPVKQWLQYRTPEDAGFSSQKL